MAVEVPLTRGAVTLIDEEDAERVLAYRWRANGIGTKLYAVRWQSGNPRRICALHRLLMDAPPGMHVDHIDGDGLNNQRSNLRVVTPSVNGHNRHGAPRSVTGLRNVYRVTGSRRYQGQVGINGRLFYLGTFGSVEEALAAVAAKRAEFGLLPVEASA